MVVLPATIADERGVVGAGAAAVDLLGLQPVVALLLSLGERGLRAVTCPAARSDPRPCVSQPRQAPRATTARSEKTRLVASHPLYRALVTHTSSRRSRR